MVHEKNRVDFSTGETKKVNANFSQLYDDNLDLIMLIAENPTATRVFWWIVKYMDNRNALVASQQAIADSLGLHKNTIYLAVKYLKEKKVLTVLKSSNTHIFALNAQIIWRDSADAKRFAHFDAKVFISEFEQEKDDKPAVSKEMIGHLKTKTQAQTKAGRTRTRTGMNAFWNGLSELEFWAVADDHIHNDYREHYLAEDIYTSYKSVNRLLKYQRDVVGRVLARLITDGDVVLNPIDTGKRPLDPVTVIDQIIIDNTFDLLETWVDDFAARLLLDLNEDQQFDEDQDW